MSLFKTYQRFGIERSRGLVRLSQFLRHAGTQAPNPQTQHESPKVASSSSKKITITSSEEADFSEFPLSDVTLSRLEVKGVAKLFPIQAATFMSIYEGQDVLAKAATGTGKTLSFALPVIERLLRQPRNEPGRAPRVIALAPTRELAQQVYREFSDLSPSLSTACFTGGSPYGPQERAIEKGLDILVATPGRLQDHLERKYLSLEACNHLILDEADRMLEVGFAEAVDEINEAILEQSGNKPQVILFSATVPSFVRHTIRDYMNKDYVTVDLLASSSNKTASGIRHLAVPCSTQGISSALPDIIQVHSGSDGRAMVFTETKSEASNLALNSELKKYALVLHGDIEQKQREITLKSFREGRARCLVATNVAARGLDIPNVDLVIQASPPDDVESYIHRAGRTGRAGKSGISICLYDPRREYELKAVEKRAGIKFERASVPALYDVVESLAEGVIEPVTAVKGDKSLPQFHHAADTIIEKFDGDAKEALAAALATITGASKLSHRSLLTGSTTKTTMELHTPNVFEKPGYVYGILRDVPEDIKDSIATIKASADRDRVAYFDIDSSRVDDLLKTFKPRQSHIVLKIASNLDTLKVNENDQRGGRGRGGFDRRDGGRGRGGYGRRDGGGGRGRGGYGRGSDRWNNNRRDSNRGNRGNRRGGGDWL